MGTDDLLDDLRADGELVSTGEFELDRASAREQLRKYQLSDPRRYVLQLVMAAQWLGADAIDFEFDADEMWMEWTGAGLGRDELTNLYDAVFRDRRDERDEALWHLAVALNAVDVLQPELIRIEASRGEESSRLEIEGHGDDVTETICAEQPESSDEYVRIYLREKRRAAHLLAFARDRLTSLPEEALLREHCRYSSCPIRLDGRDLVQPPTHQDPASTYEFETPHEFCRLTVDPAGEGAAVDVVQNGVRFDRFEVAAPFGVRGTIQTDRLSLDLARDSFVDDDAYQLFTEWLVPEAVYQALLRFRKEHSELFESPERSEHTYKLQTWACRLALELANVDIRSIRISQRAKNFGQIAGSKSKFARRLRLASLWPTVEPDHGKSLDRLVSPILGNAEPIRYSRKRKTLATNHWSVLYLPQGPPPYLAELVDGRLEEVR